MRPTLVPVAWVLGLGICLSLALSCATPNRRALHRAVLAEFPCALNDYEYDRVPASGRVFNVWACGDADGLYMNEATFQCSNSGCSSLQSRAKERASIELDCPVDAIEVADALPPFVFRVSGCGDFVHYRCGMEKRVVECTTETFGPQAAVPHELDR